MENSNIELIRGHMDTIILRTLQSDDKYGLEMLNEIKSLSDELYSLKQPTMYSSLKRLEKQGYIASYPGSETKGANRTYYKLTVQGCKMLESDQKQWEFSRTIIDKLLSDKAFDSTTAPPFDTSEFRPSTKRERKDVGPKVIIKYIEVEKKIYIKDDSVRTNQFSSERLNNDFVNSDVVNEVASDLFDDDQEHTDTKFDEILSKDLDIANEPYQFYNDIQPTVDKPSDLNEIRHNELKSEYKEITFPEPVISVYDRINTDNSFLEAEYSKYSFINDNSSAEKKDMTSLNNQQSSKAELIIDDNIDYVSTFDEMYVYKSISSDDIAETPNVTDYKKYNYKQDSNKQYDYIEKQHSQDNSTSEMTMTDLKSVLAAKNIKLKPHYRNSTASFYSGKFYYSNKVLRDWSLVMYGIFMSFLLITFFTATDMGVELSLVLGSLSIGVLFPIGCMIKWSMAPLRRKRNSFMPINALLISFISLIGLSVVIIVCAFFIIQVDISDPIQYIPAIVVPITGLFMLPLSVGAYTLLYNCKRYNVG